MSVLNWQRRVCFHTVRPNGRAPVDEAGRRMVDDAARVRVPAPFVSFSTAADLRR